MKCIQSIRATKQVEVGEIKRVNDKEAESEVKSGYWKYIPKNEWKLATRKPKNSSEQSKENVVESKESNKTNKKNKK